MNRKLAPIVFCAYNVLCVGFLVALGPLAERLGVAPFKEGGLVETVQSVLLLLCCAIAAIAAKRVPGRRAVLVALAFVSGLVVLREFDSALDRLIPHIGWEGPAGILFLCGAALLYQHRRSMWREVEEFVRTVPFVVLWFGLVLTWGCAQLVGHGQFLRGVMVDYDRNLKRVLDESFETFGMCVILVGVIETVIWVRRRSAMLANGPVEAGDGS